MSNALLAFGVFVVTGQGKTMKLLLALLLTEGVLVRGLQGIRAGVTKDVTRRQLAKGGGGKPAS